MKRSIALLALALSACSASAGTELSDWERLPAVTHPDPALADLPTRDAQHQAFCAVPRGDAFFRSLCASPRPVVRDMAELLRIVGLDQNRAFALTANSTSLVKRAVSSINPRLIVFPRVDEKRQRPPEMTALGFVRGEPFVEIVSRDLATSDYNFYLFTFERACDYTPEGCDLASVLGEELESGWTAFSVYPEEQLENTTFDCRSCHQPGGHGTGKILRMQELESPWLHWFPQRFVQRTDSDRLLTAQFLEAHSVDSQYGGIPIATIEHALDEGSGAQLEALLEAEGQGDQPNAFDPRIEAEAKSGTSPTWDAQFALTLTGQAISVPYPLADVSDAALRTSRAASYRDVMNGAAARSTLTDNRDIFSADAREKLGVVPKPGASGREILLQMCSRCHDGRANPAVSRSRFNVHDLGTISNEQKLAIIQRLQEPASSIKLMPPWRAGELPAGALEAVLGELAK